MAKNPRLAAAGAGIAQAVRTQEPGRFSLGQRVQAVPRMLRDTLAGRYEGLSKRKLVMMALALGYVISPVDFIPEVVFFVFGLADDVLIGSFLAASVLSETDDYLQWEHTHASTASTPGGAARVVPGEVAG